MKKRILAICIALSALLMGCRDTQEEITVSAYEKAMEDGKISIVIDAGHGLSDVGAINEENLGDVTEADINFAIASILCGYLTEKGYTVTMTHDGKEKPDTEYDDGEATYGPTERADFSNSTDADIFLSIHCDSYPTNTDVYGTRLYYPTKTPNSSKYDELLSYTIGDALNEAFPNDKEVIQKPMVGQDAYTVLYKTVVPSVLVECGFITNKDDAEKLKNAKWQESFAKAIASGIDTYFAK